MSALRGHLDDYLRLRRGLGFKLVDAARYLADFVAYLEACGATTVTVELAIAWAPRPEGIKPISVDYRLCAARCFARYLHSIDPAHQVPPSGPLAVPRRRPAPDIYTPEQLGDVFDAIQQIKPRLPAATYRGVFGLLAVTGMRVGEALALTRNDVDLVDGVVTIRHAKFDRVRLVPLEPSVTAELRRYATTHDRLCPAHPVDRFFTSLDGGEQADRYRSVVERLASSG